MYREAATAGVIQGVLSGPYAGGARKVDVARLGSVTRARLVEVLEGHAEPTPLHREVRWTMPRLPPVAVMLVALPLLGWLTFFEYAYLETPVQPESYALAYMIGCALVAASWLVLMRRIARGAVHPPLPAGRYLLPLDVLEVAPPARDGLQIIEVTPLGEARDARLQKGRVTELVLVYARGAEIRFAMRSKAAGELVLRALEVSQALLEQLTYRPDLARALKNDPLFDVRVDNSWDAVAPAAGKPSRLRAAFVHRNATAVAVTCGLAIGVAWFSARNAASAHAARENIAAESERQAVMVAAAAKTPHVLSPEEETARRREKCSAALRANPPSYPTQAILGSFVTHTAFSGDAVVPIRFAYVVHTPAAGTFDLSLPEREHQLVNALAMVFSQSCPAEVVSLARVAPEMGAPTSFGIDVATTITWAPAPHFEKLAPTFAFEVTMRGFQVEDPVTFRLVMAPPNPLPIHVRDRSVFSDPNPSSPDRLPDLVTARAYDRLYDEMYGLWLGGDPRVPL